MEFQHNTCRLHAPKLYIRGRKTGSVPVSRRPAARRVFCVKKTGTDPVSRRPAARRVFCVCLARAHSWKMGSVPILENGVCPHFFMGSVPIFLCPHFFISKHGLHPAGWKKRKMKENGDRPHFPLMDERAGRAIAQEHKKMGTQKNGDRPHFQLCSRYRCSPSPSHATAPTAHAASCPAASDSARQ